MVIAFFLSPEGRLFQVPSTHIAAVIAEPERFGFTRAEIEAVYEKHQEPLGLEGKARNEILLRMIDRGWIRIRKYRIYWSVTARSLSPAILKRIQGWAQQMLSGAMGFREPDRYMP
jgi:hypothetical protein